MKRQRVKRTRNGGTMTEAEYWGRVRSALRKAFSHWKPATEAMKAARRPSQDSTNKRLRWQYQCAICREWFKGDDVRKDHVVPCGSLRSYDDIVPFLQRLTAESVEAYQCVCVGCHQEKTNAERGRVRDRGDV